MNWHVVNTKCERNKIIKSRHTKQNSEGIRCQNDVVSTSVQRHNFASTLIRRHSTSCVRWEENRKDRQEDIFFSAGGHEEILNEQKAKD